MLLLPLLPLLPLLLLLMLMLVARLPPIWTTYPRLLRTLTGAITGAPPTYWLTNVSRIFISFSYPSYTGQRRFLNPSALLFILPNTFTSRLD